MQLIFDNCITYNGNESEIGKISLNIEAEYKRLLKDNKLKELIEADELLKSKLNNDDDDEERIESTNKNSQNTSLAGEQTAEVN
mmetsp:Transcript_24556/g.21739  ORF Transcript_24556/g.21739 Transcript_24556/m.21739 type:complete len:84 (+) Transcript_24556:1165-1416(+)